MSFKVIDNVLPLIFAQKTHIYAEMSDQWYEGGTDLVGLEVKPEHSTFPIMPVIRNNEIQQLHPFCGWFICVAQMLAERAKTEFGLSSYDTNLQRVHLVAHRSGESGLAVPHKDHTGDYCSVIYHLCNYRWKPEWGGSTFIGDEEIPFVQNRAIMFPSNIPHYGTPPNNNCPYTRVVLNVVFKVGESNVWKEQTAQDLGTG